MGENFEAEANIANQIVAQPQDSAEPLNYDEDPELSDSQIESLEKEASLLKIEASQLNLGSLNRLKILEELFNNASEASKRRADLDYIKGMILKGTVIA